MSKALMVLQEVRECAEYWSEYYVPIGIHERIDEAIAELLAQPEHTEQEPVAWMYERQNGDFTERTLSVGFEENFVGVTIPLYTSPPKREPLGTQVSFKDSSGNLITVDISFVRELVERSLEVSSEGTWHRKNYKDRSWGI